MAWVLAPTNTLLLHFRDDIGSHSTMKFNLDNTEVDPGGGGAGAISSAAQAISDSALYETEILIVATWDAAVTPTTGPYDRPSDKVQFKFKCQDGSYVTINIGAPDEDIFEDAWDVDFGDPDVITFIGAMLSNAVSAGGSTIAVPTDGHRRRPPRRKQQ